MPDAVGLVKIIKKTAMDAMEAANPASVCFGKVTGTEPLQIKVEQKMTLGESQLVLTRNVTDHSLAVSVEWDTEAHKDAGSASISGNTGLSGEPEHKHPFSASVTAGEGSHNHTVSGRKEITIHNGLVAGDEVILIRMQGGQKFIVVDRIGK